MKPESILNVVEIASPCPARWEDMEGDECKRFCQQCSLHVYDISEMTTQEAEQFLTGEVAGERKCIRMHRRSDGRLITKDCPVGIRLLRQRILRGILRASAACLAFLASGLALAAGATKLGRWAEEKGEEARLTSQPTLPILGALACPGPPTPPATNVPQIKGSVPTESFEIKIEL